MSTLRHLVNFNRADLPISVTEVRRIEANEVHARVETVRSACILRTRAIIPIDVASPRPTKVDIEDNTHIVKMLVEGTRPL